MDLGKTDLVKHHIELTNYTPIKDRYRRIPTSTVRGGMKAPQGDA